MTLIIGLTGGIGSGKTTIAKLFNILGVPIYYTDVEAKKLMHNSKIIKRRLIAKFGDKVYQDNTLNRSFLANLVFTNKENLKYLESVVHPKVNQHFKRWLKKQNKPYILQENAILFENGSDKLCDYVLTVTAPIKVRINRVIKRDKVTEKQVVERMNNQWSDEKKINKSDFVINNITLKESEKLVLEIHNKILQLSKKL